MRKVLNIFCALSAVLCAAFLLLWMRSHYRQDWIEYARGDRGVVLLASDSIVSILIERNPRIAQYTNANGGRLRHQLSLPHSGNRAWPSYIGDSFWNRMGIGYSSHVRYS